MKKRILIFLAFFVITLLSFSSCATKTEESVLDVSGEGEKTALVDKTTENESSFPIESAEEVNEKKCRVDFLNEEIEVFDENGVLLLLSGQFIYPTVSIYENPDAERRINEYFESEKAKYCAEAEKMRLDSIELLESMESDYWNTFIYDKKYSLEFVGDKLLSFLCHTDVYQGGVHPTPDEHGVIFDMESGKRLSLTDVFTSAEALRAVAVPKISEIIRERGTEPFDGFDGDVSPIVDDDVFVLTDAGVKFICNVYVLFPYSYGISYYTVGFDEFEGIYLYEDKESYGFSRFYSFDIDGEIDDTVLGYADTREFSCPYDEDDNCIINGEERNVYYIVPAREGSNIIIERVIYDEEENEIGSEVFKSFKNTEKDFCLKITCPMAESKALYRVIITFGEDIASFDLIYTVSPEKPVKLIK